MPVLVECPAAVEGRLRRRKAIRDLAGVQPTIALRMQPDLGIEPGIANAVGRSVAALIERHASDNPDAPATVPALSAISTLSERIASLRRISDAA